MDGCQVSLVALDTFLGWPLRIATVARQVFLCVGNGATNWQPPRGLRPESNRSASAVLSGHQFPNRYIEQQPWRGELDSPASTMILLSALWPQDGQSHHIAPPPLSIPRTTGSELVWLSSTSLRIPTSRLRIADSGDLSRSKR